MKVYVDESEWYPVMSLDDKPGCWGLSARPIDLPDEEWADYQRVMNEFHGWQAKMQRMQDKLLEQSE